jgi:hypothetical protein
VWNLSSLSCLLFSLDVNARHIVPFSILPFPTASLRFGLASLRPLALAVSSQRVVEPCSAKSKHSHTH